MTSFIKMHGLGNDFILLDARDPTNFVPAAISAEGCKKLSDRNFGIGCDQILILRESKRADVYMEIFNKNGTVAEACGNGTRCVADYVMSDLGQTSINIETAAGILTTWRAAENMSHVVVDMGPVGLGWKDIPLVKSVDTIEIELTGDSEEIGHFKAICQSIGNPHAVIIVDDVMSVNLSKVGPILERNPIFSKGANISFVNKLSDGRFRMRVWERGVGITLACGSGACAVGVAVKRAGLGSNHSEIVMDGGSVFVEWQADETLGGRVIMRGPVSYVFKGELSAETKNFLGKENV